MRGASPSFYTSPMLIRLRCALMCVLLFALAFQGYAAATMLNCGPNHHPMSATTVHDAALSESVVEHQHAASGDHPHQDHHDKVSKCSVCAACCVGAALPAAALVFAPAVSSGLPTSLFSIGAVGFLTDGPDRPPRLSLV